MNSIKVMKTCSLSEMSGIVVHKCWGSCVTGCSHWAIPPPRMSHWLILPWNHRWITALDFRGCMFKYKSEHEVSTDGAPAYSGHCVRKLLNAVFLWRWSGYGAPLHWLPQSLHLNSVDYFVWGHIKENVCHKFYVGVWRTQWLYWMMMSAACGNNWFD
jgi:hypothetical protein